MSFLICKIDMIKEKFLAKCYSIEKTHELNDYSILFDYENCMCYKEMFTKCSEYN